MFKLLADECIHADMVLALRQSDFDARTVRQASLTGADDEAVFAYAAANDFVLLTLNQMKTDVLDMGLKGKLAIIGKDKIRIIGR